MNRIPPTIDMTPDGAFRVPPNRVAAPLSLKLLIGAVLVASVAGALTVAALAIWVVSLLLPVAILAAGGAWLALRYRRWQSLRGERNLRPHV